MYRLIFSVLIIIGSTSPCLQDWNNQCTQNSDCCSQNCVRGNANWAHGVCRPGNGGGGHRPRPAEKHRGGGGGGGGGKRVSWSEFSQAVTTSGYPSPQRAQYDSFLQGIPKGGIKSKREAAMALAQFLHESGGLRYKEELACKDNPSACGYRTAGCDVPGKNYHGRGYVQLTWCYNYRATGQDLGLGDQLVRDPDRVARDENLAWAVSFSYWKRNVHNQPGIREGRFGVSTRAINGALECNGQNRDKAESRFRIYSKVFAAFHVKGQPNPQGCYS